MNINTLLGKTLTKIEGLEKHSDFITFYCSDGDTYQLHHQQDCCEVVDIEDVCGDKEWLLNSPILQAEESTSNDNPVGLEKTNQDWSFTYTFYRLATIKGQVVIRWYGESNGYYSESVDFTKV